MCSAGDDPTTYGTEARTVMTFVPPSKAYQHLNRDGEQVSLCGYPFDDIYAPKVYDHRDGFDPKGGPACERCADKADRIQNGRR